MTQGVEKTNYEQLCDLCKRAGTLHSVQALLGWDQETYMPAGGAAARSDQAAELASLVHQQRTSAQMGDLVAACEADGSLPPLEQRNVELMRRDYDRLTKLPESLVSELAKVGSQAQEAWKAARLNNDFTAFKPWLERMMTLSTRKAECYGTPVGGELYDALLDEYEPDTLSKDIEAVFAPLAAELSELVGALLDAPHQPSDAPMRTEVETERQHVLGQHVLKAMGFDLSAGRLDVTTHPFCEGLAAGDTRLTTRYRDDNFLDALYSTLHEMGHGMYEQGLPKMDRPGQPLADSVSLGIHESQSRLWENFVGRSEQFWAWFTPVAHEHLGESVRTFDERTLFAAANRTERSYIRVEADEATYNLHVMLRFELERAMIRGDLSVADLPGAWNERFEQLLGAKVPDDRRGCLQDVHWSFGLIGYFPTYTLGTLYAAQLWQAAREQIAGLEDQISRGEFAPLLGWLREGIHAHGRRFTAGELCERMTGRPLTPEPLMAYLKGKLEPLYGLTSSSAGG